MTTSYRAAVETGSCSLDCDGDLGRRWEERATCGHAHKTREAAEKCGEKLRAYDPKTRQCSGLWAYPVIHDADGHRA